MRTVLGPLAAGLLLSGCVATQRDILDLSQQSDTISLQIHNLKKVTASVQTNAADLNVKLDQLHTDLTVLNEQLKDNRESMSALSSKLDDLDAAMGSQAASLSRSINSTKNLLITTEAKRRRQEALRKKKDDKRRKAEEEARRKAARGPTPSQIYHSARIQLSKKKYSAAVKGFEVYLERWPKGEMVDLAAYYLGQAHYGKKKWQDAARNFAFVLDKYPKSPVTPSARLRYAQSLLKLKLHRIEAKRYLESIPLDYPRSPEAKKAKEILRSWDQPAKKAKKKPSKKKSAKRPAKKSGKKTP